MASSEEECAKFTKKYADRMESFVFCRGWDKPLPHPNKISTKLLNEWLIYFIKPYRNNFSSTNWDHDIVCVLKGEKKLAFTENDNFDIFDETNLDLELRYIPQLYCNLRTIVIDDVSDPSYIWYKAENWEWAVMYYLYINDMLEEYKFTFSSFNSDFIHSILLDYTYNSSIMYFLKPGQWIISNYLLKTAVFRKLFADYFKKSPVFADYIERIDYDEYLNADPDMQNRVHRIIILENINYFLKNLTLKMKKMIYQEVYNKYFEMVKNPSYSIEEFEKQKSIVEKYLHKIRKNKVLEAFGRSNNIMDLISTEAKNL